VDLVLSLPAAEMQMVWNALMEIPGKHTYAICRKIETQLQAQGALPPGPEQVKPNEPPPTPAG
jgi:hypothetical protein